MVIIITSSQSKEMKILYFQNGLVVALSYYNFDESSHLSAFASDFRVFPYEDISKSRTSLHAQSHL